MDIRLKTARFELDGQEYKLACNMNVLADVQEMYGGKLSAALDGGNTRSALCFLTAMINDCRDERGEPPLTVKQVGRLLPAGRVKAVRETVLPLITLALQSDDAAAEQEKNEKNA